MPRSSAILARPRRARSASSSPAASIPGANARSTAPMPRHIDPMLAVLSTLPPSRDMAKYAFEYKWDGVRALGYLDGTGSSPRLHLESRNLLDITHKYPELHALAKAVGKHRAIFDGEIIALDDLGRPSFPRLQQRMGVVNPPASLMAQVPVYYALFDLLWLDGRSLMDEPWERRREILEGLTVAGPNWHVSPAHVGEGATMHAAAEENQLEGIVAKRL